jgi:hypothetical protein
MSLSIATLEAAVNSAFAAAGELVKTAQLVNKDPSGFSWTQQELTDAQETPTGVQVILYEQKKLDGSGAMTSAIIRSNQYNPSVYSKIIIDGVTYGIIDYVESVVVTELILERTNAV